MYMSYGNPPFELDLPFELVPRQDDAAEPVFKLYHYDPTIAGAVIFVLLFVGTTFFHVYQLWRARTWFMIPLVIGGVCKYQRPCRADSMSRLREKAFRELDWLYRCSVEFVGYAGRARSGQESPDWTLPPYIIQALLILVAPALFAATIYMELGRIVTLVEGEDYTLIRKKWLTKIFVCGDVLSFMVQSAGKCKTNCCIAIPRKTRDW
jgi:hypothetical protein